MSMEGELGFLLKGVCEFVMHLYRKQFETLKAFEV